MTALPLIDAVTPLRRLTAEKPDVQDQSVAPDFGTLVMSVDVRDELLIGDSTDVVVPDNALKPDRSEVDVALAEVTKFISDAAPKPLASEQQAIAQKGFMPPETVDLKTLKQVTSADPKETTKVASVVQAVVEGKMPVGPLSDAVKPTGPVLSEMKLNRTEGQPRGLTEAKSLDDRLTSARPEMPIQVPIQAQQTEPWTDRKTSRQNLGDVGRPQPKGEATQPTVQGTNADIVVQNENIQTTVRDITMGEPPKQIAVMARVDAEGSSPLPMAERVVSTMNAPILPPAIFQSSDMARHAAHQMAAAVVQQQGRMTEIALNPEELGRVRLVMTAVDAAITLTVAAERPETADLLRRHIDVLTQEFRALGYEDINFSFGSESQSDADPEERMDGFAAEVSDPDVPLIQPATTPMSGLDLRL
mgnify:CR=1 FL=1